MKHPGVDEIRSGVGSNVHPVSSERALRTLDTEKRTKGPWIVALINIVPDLSISARRISSESIGWAPDRDCIAECKSTSILRLMFRPPKRSTTDRGRLTSTKSSEAG